ncbi:MAG: VOC family protein [Acidimicrobiia bacterium]|nr:VOC family protein [Acidimicrobiia bacterium]
MPLHRLTHVTLAAPDPAAASDFYAEFGLIPTTSGRFATEDGGEQLRLVEGAHRRVLELGLGVESTDDLDQIGPRLAEHGFAAERDGDELRTHDPVTGMDLLITVAAPVTSAPRSAASANAPGAITRRNQRAEPIDRAESVRPRKLGHVVIGSTDHAATQRLFTDGLGFAISDEIPGIAAFLRCSTDHHNVLVQDAPTTYVHHTSWQVDDVDEIGRGARHMLDGDPNRHVWGLGRHYLGSNFFWYLRDPAGTFAEYYADLDVIDDPSGWTPRQMTDARALYAWGPPPPLEFVAPTDLETHS